MKTLKFVSVLFLSIFVPAAIAHAQPPVEAYAEFDDISSVSLSPEGRQLVMLAGRDHGARSAVVINLDTNESLAIPLGDATVLGVQWVSEDYLYVAYSDRRWVDAGDDRADLIRPVILQADGEDFYELDATWQLANIDLEHPDHILVWGPKLEDQRDRRSSGEIFLSQALMRHRLGSRNNQRTVAVGEAETAAFVLGPDNEPAVRIDREGPEVRIFAKLANGSGWDEIHREILSLERFGRDGRRWEGEFATVDGVGPEGRYLWFTREGEGSRSEVARFDLETDRIEEGVIQSELADVTSILRDWRDNSVIGVSWAEERRVVEYFDPFLASVQEQLEAAFPDDEVRITDWDNDMSRLIVLVEGGTTFGRYYLLERDTMQLRLLSHRRRSLSDEFYNPVRVIEYEARDGLELFGYLTLPRGREATDLPMVLMPHGGPQARDFYGFNEWAQLLASRGYAVFQPQFRGSDGFGDEFVELGHGEWGRAMQDDLTDAVRHLVDDGVVAQDRVCIWGWSYGGYAALAGATLTPDLYRCAAAGAAVSDIPEMMRYEEDRFDGASVNYWTDYIGDWRREEDEMIAISPARQADRIQAPIMLIHGTDDLIVPYEQAELMAEAMDAAGKPYELVAIEDGVHHSVRMTYDQKLQLYRALTRFLLEHNPPDRS